MVDLTEIFLASSLIAMQNLVAACLNVWAYVGGAKKPGRGGDGPHPRGMGCSWPTRNMLLPHLPCRPNVVPVRSNHMILVTGVTTNFGTVGAPPPWHWGRDWSLETPFSTCYHEEFDYSRPKNIVIGMDPKNFAVLGPCCLRMWWVKRYEGIYWDAGKTETLAPHLSKSLKVIEPTNRSVG